MSAILTMPVLHCTVNLRYRNTPGRCVHMCMGIHIVATRAVVGPRILWNRSGRGMKTYLF